MAGLKTRVNNASVDRFIKGIKNEQTREDCFRIIEVMKQAAKAGPKMWGTGIVGFGNHHYKYESGREGDWFQVGFSPRKQNITLYFMGGLTGQEELLRGLGKYTTGKGCLHIKKLEDVDIRVLKKLVNSSIKSLKKKAP